MSREEALQTIRGLIEEYQLSSTEVMDFFDEGKEPSRLAGITSTLLAYVGGLLMTAGAGIFMATFWEQLGIFGRIATTFGSGTALFVAGVGFVVRSPASRACVPLFLLGGALQCTGLFVGLEDLQLGWDYHFSSMLIFGALALQYGSAFYSLRKTSLLFVTLLLSGCFAGVVFNELKVDSEIAALLAGIPLMLIAYATQRTSHHSIAGIVYFTGSILFFWGAFEVLQEFHVDLLFLGLCCYFVFLSTVLRSRTLLFTSCLASLSYLGYFTRMHFVDSVGWPLSLIALGVLFLLVSGGALRLGRRIAV